MPSTPYSLRRYQKLHCFQQLPPEVRAMVYIQYYRSSTRRQPGETAPLRLVSKGVRAETDRVITVLKPILFGTMRMIFEAETKSKQGTWLNDEERYTWAVRNALTACSCLPGGCFLDDPLFHTIRFAKSVRLLSQLTHKARRRLRVSSREGQEQGFEVKLRYRQPCLLVHEIRDI